MGSWLSIYNNTMWGVGSQLSRIADLQEQISSGTRIRRTSDDPSEAYRVLSLRSDVEQFTQYNDNIGEVETSLKQADNSIRQLSKIMTRATQLIAQGASGTYMNNNRKAIAGEIDELLEQAVGLGNTNVLGRYIFAGEYSTRPPYEVTRNASGKIEAVNYRGSFAERPVLVASGVKLSGQIIGDNVFRNHERSDPQIVGDDTGLKVGTGTSSARGNFWMKIKHADTEFVASPITSGTDSSQDTIIGKHQITITGNQAKLDNGTAVTFAAGANNVKLTSDDGSIVYVNLSAATDGTFDVVGKADVKIGNQTHRLETADFDKENLPIKTEDGRIFYADTRSLKKEGSVGVNIPGTADIFNTLLEIRNTLNNSNNLNSSELSKALDLSKKSLDKTNTAFLQRATMVGGRLASLDIVKNTLDEMKYLAKSEADVTEQADIVSVTTNLARTQTLYEMSLMTAKKALSTTLLDYLR